MKRRTSDLPLPVEEPTYTIVDNVEIQALRDQQGLPIMIAFNGGTQAGEFSFRFKDSTSTGRCHWLFNTSKMKVARKQ